MLRGEIGEEIIISTGEDADYHCKIRSYTEDCAVLSISFLEALHELETKLILLQALPKAEKMELIIQKAVELGVTEVLPLAAENCIVKLGGEKAEKKRGRWQAIAEAAAKQSKRSRIPSVFPVCSWKEAFSAVEKADLKLLPYENEIGVRFTKEQLIKVEELARKKGLYCCCHRPGRGIFTRRGRTGACGGLSSHQSRKAHPSYGDCGDCRTESPYDASGVWKRIKE